MQTLIVGFGSIGRKHAKALQNLGCEINLVTSQKTNDFCCYSTVQEALTEKTITYVIIAYPTNLHYSILIALIEYHYQEIVLVEKPLFSKVDQLPKNQFKKILVAYNLRFNDLLIKAKKLVETQKIITFTAYVGQYLPSWRPTLDYRKSYSASKAQGGGVLRDLSHELDYSIWFCGACLKVTAKGGHFSNLEIDSDDVYSIIMECSLCPLVSIHVNYLDQIPRREIIINTSEHTFSIDLIKGVLSIDGAILFQSNKNVFSTYYEQHKAVLNKNFDSFCSYTEGLSIMKLIEAIEVAAKSHRWIYL